MDKALYSFLVLFFRKNEALWAKNGKVKLGVKFLVCSTFITPLWDLHTILCYVIKVWWLCLRFQLSEKKFSKEGLGSTFFVQLGNEDTWRNSPSLRPLQPLGVAAKKCDSAHLSFTVLSWTSWVIFALLQKKVDQRTPQKDQESESELEIWRENSNSIQTNIRIFCAKWDVQCPLSVIM